MPTVATVKEIWRFPVKSMQGERVDRCTLGPRGIPGDRGPPARASPPMRPTPASGCRNSSAAP